MEYPQKKGIVCPISCNKCRPKWIKVLERIMITREIYSTEWFLKVIVGLKFKKELKPINIKI